MQSRLQINLLSYVEYTAGCNAQCGNYSQSNESQSYKRINSRIDSQSVRLRLCGLQRFQIPSGGTFPDYDVRFPLRFFDGVLKIAALMIRTNPGGNVSLKVVPS